MPSSIIGSIFGGSATKDSNQGLNNASAVQQELLNSVKSQEAPYQQFGLGGLSNLSYLLGIGPQGGYSAPGADGQQTTYAPNTSLGAYGSLSSPFTLDKFQKDPGYQFMLDQGQQALKASQAANGTLLSGAGLKGLDRYTQGLASQEYQQAFNNYNTNQNNLYNRLMGATNVGQNANSQVTNAATGVANNQSNYQQQIGNNYASNDLNRGASWSTGLGNIGSIVGAFL